MFEYSDESATMTYLIPILLLIGSEIENIMQPCKKLYEVGNFLKICSKHQIESRQFIDKVSRSGQV